jgi:hypothetical protein
MTVYMEFENRIMLSTLERISAISDAGSSGLEVSELGWYVKIKGAEISHRVLKEQEEDIQIASNKYDIPS